MAALEAEMNHHAQQYGRLCFDTLYLGGGTPSALEPREFEKIYSLLNQAFDFKPGYEWTVEVNPGDIDRDKIDAYKRAGVNRVSLGVQAVQPRLLQDMNRPHLFSEVEQTIASLREAAITNLSMDIILNLPGQTLADVSETLDRLLKFEPNQVSVYDLDVHEKTVYGQRRRMGRLKLASETDHAAMAELVANRLESAGMVHYELSNFARPGFESRHNLIYWDNQPYLGLGPGAFSYMENCRFQTAASVADYFQKSARNDWAPQTEDRLTPEEIEKETFLTGIRLSSGIDTRRLTLLREEFEKKALDYLEEGLLEKDGFRLKFTSTGKLIAENILQNFAQIERR